jgi:YbbR domain-containing protein
MEIFKIGIIIILLFIIIYFYYLNKNNKTNDNKNYSISYTPQSNLLNEEPLIYKTPLHRS